MSAPSVRSELSSRARALFFGVAVGWSALAVGCDDGAAELGEALLGGRGELEEPSASRLIRFDGHLSLRVSPQDQSLAPLIIQEISALPSELTVQLEGALRTTGTVSVALDPASDPLPVEARVWALNDESEGLLPVASDEDPFSNELFLLSLSARLWSLGEGPSSELLRVRSPYRFEIEPLGYPPHRLQAYPSTRLSLTLPPLSTLHQRRGRLVIDPYSLQPLVGATLVVTQDGARVSELARTDSNGGYELSWWSDALSESPLVFTLIPPLESRLPVGRFEIDPAVEPEVLRAGSYEQLAPVALPRLAPVSYIRVGVEGDDLSLWHAHMTQLWGAERLTGDPVDPVNVSRRGEGEVKLRAMGLWESQTILSAQEPGELWVFPREGVLTLRPPVEHPARTTRIELSEMGGDISSAPVLKQRVLGQVTDERGALIPDVELYALQRAWPWLDTPHLPLGERWSFSSAEGGVDIPLDPGQYALRLRAPPELGLAPRVTLTQALELGDVTIDVEQLKLSPGVRFTLEVIDPQQRPSQAIVELFCELQPPYEQPRPTSALSEVFWGAVSSLNRAQASPRRRVLLARGTLDAEGRWSVRLAERSCPEQR